MTSEDSRTLHTRRTELSAVWRYGLSVASIAAAIGLISLMEAYLPVAPHVSLFLCAILFSTWFCGIRPGLLASVLSVTAFDYFFLPPLHSLTVEVSQLPRFVMFVVAIFCVCGVSVLARRTREALEESTARLKEAQRLARIGYWERDLLTDHVHWSEEVCRILGVPPPRVLSEAELQKMIHPDDRQLLREALNEALEGKQGYDVEFRVVRPDGEVRSVHAWDEIAYDQSGRPIRMFGTVQDITERKRAAEELRKNQELLQLVLATLPVGVAVTDRAGNLLLVNAASKRIWGDVIVSGRQRWQQTKASWHDSGEGIAPTAWASVRALSNGETSLNELIDIETYDGLHQKTIENSAAPIRDGEGLIVGAVIVNEDVTEKVRAEDQLRRSNETLRALSARLHSVREEESARIAREIHDELGAVLSVLKWDLEEVQQVIPDRADQLAELRQKIEAMVQLADSAIANVKRISSELRPIALEEFGLLEGLRWYAQDFQARTGISVNCDFSVDEIDLDQEQSTAVFRIFQEAMTNVLRHAQATRVDIRINKQDGEIGLTIRDNGRGFVDTSPSDPQSLGLLGMRERAQLLAGEISFESAPEGGCVVTLRVPTPVRKADSRIP
jgi:PAS domain S-box-containing protein